MTTFLDPAVYGGLFLIAFAAATILPLQSEAALVAALLLNEHPTWALVVVASAGNILGSALNWFIGRSLCTERIRARLGITPSRFYRARVWFERYGRWSLLLSWMPVVGDPLTFVAGVLRTPFAEFMLLVTIAKAGRYLGVAAATLAIA